ncbi:MAG: hypothetical protein R3C26_20700 [Calditrichia bacterium]
MTFFNAEFSDEDELALDSYNLEDGKNWSSGKPSPKHSRKHQQSSAGAGFNTGTRTGDWKNMVYKRFRWVIIARILFLSRLFFCSIICCWKLEYIAAVIIIAG